MFTDKDTQYIQEKLGKLNKEELIDFVIKNKNKIKDYEEKMEENERKYISMLAEIGLLDTFILSDMDNFKMTERACFSD